MRITTFAPGQYRRYFQNIKESAQQPKNAEYTTAVFSFLVVSLFGWYAIRPTIQTILTLRKEIEDNKIVSQQMEEKIGKLIEAQAVYDVISNKLPLLTQAIPNDPESLDAVRQLRNLAYESQASLSAISVASVPLISSQGTDQETKSPETRAETLKASNKKIIDIPITIIASGGYENIRKFIEGILTMRRLATIDSVNVVPDTEASTSVSGDIMLKLVLKLNAHYIGE